MGRMDNSLFSGNGESLKARFRSKTDVRWSRSEVLG